VRTRRDAVVLTPEHVPILLTPAGLGSRSLALLVDVLLIFAGGALLRLILGALLPGGIGILLSSTGAFVLTWGYHVYFEVRHAGQTIGKRALSLRVVDDRGLPLNAYQSFVRNVARALDFLPFGYGAGALCCFADRHHRRLGDLAAGTLVVQERMTLAAGSALLRPLRYNSLDVPEIRRRAKHRLGLEDRELLLALMLRAPYLTPAARFDVMEAAAQEYRRRLAKDDDDLPGESFMTNLAALVLAAPSCPGVRLEERGRPE